MKRFIPLITTLFCCLIVFSQNVTIKGNIIASSDGLPVKDVNISVKGKTIGTSSDEKGNFILKNVSLPCDLKISHIAFLSKEVSLTKKDISKKNTINLNISLADKTTLISEIVIRAKPYYRLERLVYDFEIDDNYVYTITNKNDKKHLSVYTFEDYRKRTQEIPKECNEISYDCHNKLRIKKEGKEDYWRITSSDTSLKYYIYDSLINGVGYIIANSNNYIENKYDAFEIWFKDYFKEGKGYQIEALINNGVNIIACFDNGVYFSNEKGWWRQHKELYRIYTDSKGKIKFRKVYYIFSDIDEWLNFNTTTSLSQGKIIENLNISNKQTNKFSLMMKSNSILGSYVNRAITTPFWIQDPYTGIPKANPMNLKVQYMNKAYPIPVYFESTQKHLYIFNYEKGAIHKIDENNNFISSTKMDPILTKDWLNKILFNREGNRCFIIQNQTTLKELDLNTGEYIRTIKLPQNRIEKIRIVKDYIYYTAAVEGANALERQLFKLKINDELTQK
ncbi:MAG: carboxypeptidase-like regulatory domain-containing protein [Bacteroidales bacterium]|nr:carboxypeptidase-like regulatory domain-containing protein [Bacteroidales bacterium]